VLDRIMEALLTDITPTISLLELIWTGPAVFAWVRYGHRAGRALRAERQLTAEQQRLSLRMREKIRAERFLFLAFVSECMVLVGVISMLQPPSAAAVADSPVAVLGPFLLVAMQWAVILKGERIERDERALSALYEAESQAARQAQAAVKG
jgi:hypothetical protein